MVHYSIIKIKHSNKPKEGRNWKRETKQKINKTEQNKQTKNRREQKFNKMTNLAGHDKHAYNLSNGRMDGMGHTEQLPDWPTPRIKTFFS